MFAARDLALDFLLVLLSSFKSWAQTLVSAVTSSTDVKEGNIFVPTMVKKQKQQNPQLTLMTTKVVFCIKSERKGLCSHLVCLKIIKKKQFEVKSRTMLLTI